MTHMGAVKPGDEAWTRLLGEVDRALEKRFGYPEPKEVLDPLSGLIATILSQNTSDRNSERAFERLREAYPTWEQALEAGQEGVEEAIRPGGLAPTKAARILSILGWLARGGSGLSLNHLRDLPTPKIEEILAALPGVGPKTLACVLLFHLGRPAFPMDTHVFRVATRVGLIPPAIASDRAHGLLKKHVPVERHYPLHLNMIRLGRTICRPTAPECPRCPLREMCAYAKAQGA